MCVKSLKLCRLYMCVLKVFYIMEGALRIQFNTNEENEKAGIYYILIQDKDRIATRYSYRQLCICMRAIVFFVAFGHYKNK